MKSRAAALIPFLLLCVLALAAPVHAQQASDFKVGRVVLSKAISEREPVGITTNFDLDDEKAYCFLEAVDIEKNTHVVFIWYYQDKKTARIELPLHKGNRWRTYSSKKFGIRKGDWRVDVKDSAGMVVESLSFTVK